MPLEDETELLRQPDGTGRVQRDTETARTLITAALLAELGRRLYEYENTITWNTTCTSCATVLDSSIRETVRREQAEATLARITARVRHRLETAIVDGPVSEVCRDVLAIIGTGEESRG